MSYLKDVSIHERAPPVRIYKRALILIVIISYHIHYLQQNLAPTKCKVPSTKVLALCNSGRLPTVTSVALPLSLGWLFSNTRGVSLSRIAKAMEWRL
jgi:hypothetical protein